jgi:hypothetical protein
VPAAKETQTIKTESIKIKGKCPFSRTALRGSGPVVYFPLLNPLPLLPGHLSSSSTMRGDFFKKLKSFDAYPKTLEDFRVRTVSGAAGTV